MRDIPPGQGNDPKQDAGVKAVMGRKRSAAGNAAEWHQTAGKGESMKIECDVIKDLLPLYTEQIASEASNRMVEEHLKACDQCRKAYQEMKTPKLRIQYDRTPAESFDRYVKKKKWRFGSKVAAITIAVTLLAVCIRLALIGSLIAFLALDGRQAEVSVDTDAGHYLWYMGENAQEEYVSKWGMDESIFPGEITGRMNVADYKMVYYDPWDAQYLSYLVVDYEEEDYEAEVQRLKEYASTEYQGYFGAEGFREAYTLLAMEADPSQGMVYALAAEEGRIVYVELIFCNYFYDIDYKDMISEEYLPVGFDAAKDNLYRQQRLAGISDEGK